MDKSILVSVVGKTDPIRGEHDGPILHIIRHYNPEKVILILTKEISKDELEYHYMEEAIHLLAPDIEVELISTDITAPHSYDDFSIPLLSICEKEKKAYPGYKILLNITSGTPQMETALCMIAISDISAFVPVQVASPEKSANRAPYFNCRTDLVSEWYEVDVDNDADTPSRCNIPKLLNFKRPMLQSQILSLIRNYDYMGAYQLYDENKELFSHRVGQLLRHGVFRLNLEYKEAEATAGELGIRVQLYPVSRSDIIRLVEFFNTMQIKQRRRELNDFVLRLEVMTEYLAIYILEKNMRISLDDITISRKKKKSNVMFLSEEKCVAKIPGIKEYLDEQFSDKRSGRFEWGREINSLSLVHIVRFLSQQKAFQKYEFSAEEMLKWVDVSNHVRNPAAHTIISITDKEIRGAYDNKDSGALCRMMKTVLFQVFGSEVQENAFTVYEKLNQFIEEEMKQ